MWKDILRNRFVVIISPQYWGGMWVSKHWIAHELSQYNKVLFVEPPTWVGGSCDIPSASGKSPGACIERPKDVAPDVLGQAFEYFASYLQHGAGIDNA